MKRGLCRRYAWLLLTLATAGCGRSESPLESRPTSARERYNWDVVIKVKVTRTGKIYVDNAAATMERLTQELDKVRQKNGVVWIYREDEDVPLAREVMKAVTDRRMPYRPYQQDFE